MRTVSIIITSVKDLSDNYYEPLLACATDFKDFKVDVKLAGHALPPFHSLALFIHLLLPTFAMVPIGLYPPTANTPHAIPVIPTPHNILDHVTRSGCTNLVTIPTLIQIWAQDPKAVAVLASLNSVVSRLYFLPDCSIFTASAQIYGGACLPSKIGNALTDSGVHITPIYGTTEFGPPIYIFRKEEDKNDWEYLRFSDRGNVRWAAQGDGSYEGQFLVSKVVFHLGIIPNSNSCSSRPRILMTSAYKTCRTQKATLPLIYLYRIQQNRTCGKCSYIFVFVRKYDI